MPKDALGEGSDGTDRAVEAQGRALRALQQGAQGLAKQMAQGQQGDGEGQQDSEEGEGQDDGTGDRTGMDSDPLGRPRATHGTSGRDLELGRASRRGRSRCWRNCAAASATPPAHRKSRIIWSDCSSITEIAGCDRPDATASSDRSIDGSRLGLDLPLSWSMAAAA